MWLPTLFLQASKHLKPVPPWLPWFCFHLLLKVGQWPTEPQILLSALLFHPAVSVREVSPILKTEPSYERHMEATASAIQFSGSLARLLFCSAFRMCHETHLFSQILASEGKQQQVPGNSSSFHKAKSHWSWHHSHSSAKLAAHVATMGSRELCQQRVSGN